MAKQKLSLTNDPTHITIENAIDSYYSYCETRGLSPQTVRNYTKTLEDFFAFTNSLYLKYMNEIDVYTFERYVHYLRDTKERDSTVNFYITNLRAFIKWAAERKFLQEFKMRNIKEDKPLQPVLSEDELKVLLRKPTKPKDFIEFQTWALECFLFGTGARIGATLDLKIEDIDLKANTITMNRTKNRKGIIIPISHSLNKVLVEFLKKRKGHPEDYLFCNAYGDKASESSIARQIHNYNLARGINKSGAHIFRRAFAKQYILNGGNTFALQKLMCHSSITTTKVYVDLYSTDLQKDYNKLNPLDNLTLRGEKIKIK